MLAHAWSGGMSNDAVELLVGAADKDPMLWAIAVLLMRVDLPSAQESIVRQRAASEERAKKMGIR